MLSHSCRLAIPVNAAIAARVSSATPSLAWPRAARATTAAVYRSDDAFTGGLLLAWGLVGMLVHVWLQPLVSLA